MTEAKDLHTAVDTVVKFLDKVSSLINKNLIERRTIEKCSQIFHFTNVFTSGSPAADLFKNF